MSIWFCQPPMLSIFKSTTEFMDENKISKLVDFLDIELSSDLFWICLFFEKKIIELFDENS